MRNADTDRRLADEGDGDHAPRHGLAVGELGSRLTAGGSSGERDAPARDLVRAGDDLSLVARLRVDEQEEHGVASVEVDAEQSASAAAERPAARGSEEVLVPTPTGTDESNASAEQPLSIAPSSVIAPVPVIPATRASPAAA